MPLTSSSNAQASSSKRRLEDAPAEPSPSSADTIETHLTAVKNGLTDLREELARERKKSARLQAEVDALHGREDVDVQPRRTRSNSNNVSVQVRIKNLEAEVRKLQKGRLKDKKRIANLREREIRADARELVDEQENGVPDTAHTFLKLLREFHDIVSSPALAESEECSICLEEMQPEFCSSFSCQHIVCDNCITQIPPVGSELVQCPHCRRETSREELEPVDMTATQQWDRLLDVATRFAAKDRRGEQETSEEEEEEERREHFIDDDDDASSPGAESGAPEEGGDIEGNDDVPMDDPEPANEPANDLKTPPSTPPRPSEGLSYSESPLSVKRKKLADLAAARNLKKRR
ncbi:hypothetical protein FA95DRAFT_663066 [Auriscalpium vulgare]|uniref:Uncharacterized protein n=1 Tax=Auriscalpium vulgare TaxID=40419 RepID=A0ACB8S251_9AGAM|nr:hypothetical protein FA95DRAFT_663066 [Auriscalpium vulgare]